MEVFRRRGRFGATKDLVTAGIVLGAWVAGGETSWAGPLLPLQTTSEDYFQPGTQPNHPNADPIETADNCFFCHAAYDIAVEPYRPWAASMMGQAARDPMLWACLTVANQDAVGAGQFCMRCHIPNAFLGGRHIPADGSGLITQDFESVNCNFCHRLVNPEFPVPPDAPAADHGILKELQTLGQGENPPQDWVPPQASNARYIVDPVDARRGPFPPGDFVGNPHNPIEIIESPLHRKSDACWTCHDVSNMLMMRQPDDTHDLIEPLGTPHPTHELDDMFPLHRTYSEWKNSYYITQGGVQHDGRFGGNHPTGIMEVCQDCHMPDQQGKGCGLGQFAARPDIPQHSFIGSNTWGLKAVRAVDADGDNNPDFPDGITGLSQESVDAAIARNLDLLDKATDLLLGTVNDDIRVRIINRAGHKVPSGFPDGRRMWINVKWLNINGDTVLEHGAYDFDTGDLVSGDTTVYEIKLGITADQAVKTGLPEGETFHFMLANTIVKDNRIPVIGWSDAVAQQNQTMPVGATYTSGQHWDDTFYAIPECATDVVVTVYYQLVSKDYIEFLRDTNVTDNRGQVAWEMWNDPAVGNKSEPVIMDMGTLQLTTEDPTDIDGSGTVDVGDLLAVLAVWGPCPPGPCPADLDCDGVVGIGDLLIVLGRWGQ